MKNKFYKNKKTWAGIIGSGIVVIAVLVVGVNGGLFSGNLTGPIFSSTALNSINNIKASLTATNSNSLVANISSSNRDYFTFQFTVPNGSAPSHAYFYVNDKQYSSNNVVYSATDPDQTKALFGLKNSIGSPQNIEKFLLWNFNGKTNLYYFIDAGTALQKGDGWLNIVFSNMKNATTKLKLCNADDSICSESTGNAPLSIIGVQ
jgi:hypothetical protein